MKKVGRFRKHSSGSASDMGFEERILRPGVCDSCRFGITPGIIAFYVYSCHRHVVCNPCLRKMLDDNPSGCPFCDKENTPKSPRSPKPPPAPRPTLEPKKFVSNTWSSAPWPRPSPEGKTLSPKRDKPPQVPASIMSQSYSGGSIFDEMPRSAHTPKLHRAAPDGNTLPKPLPKSPPREGRRSVMEPQYSDMFIPNTPRSVTFISEHVMKKTGFTCWRTSADGVLAVGSDSTPTITLVDKDGEFCKHMLTCGGDVHAGLTLDSKTTLVMVDNPTTVYTIKFDPTSRSSSLLSPNFVLQIQNPIYPFSMGYDRFGILCESPTRVVVFSSVTLEIVKTVTLGYSSPSQADTACITPGNRICVLSRFKQCIHLYDAEGQELGMLGRQGQRLQNVPGRLYSPSVIHCCADGTLLVTCEDHTVHAIDGDVSKRRSLRNGDPWRIVKEGQNGYLYHCAWSSQHMWGITAGNAVTLYMIRM